MWVGAWYIHWWVPSPVEGTLSWKQCIPKKRSHFGLKAFVFQKDLPAMFGMLFCTQVVILYSSENIDSNYHVTKVELILMEDLLHKGHCVYTDNWYTSIEIYVLNNNTTDVIVTLWWDLMKLWKRNWSKVRQLFNMDIKWPLQSHITRRRAMSLWLQHAFQILKTVVQRCGVETTLPTVIHA